MALGIAIGVFVGLIAGGVIWFRRVRGGDAYKPLKLREAMPPDDDRPPQDPRAPRS